MNKKNNMTKKEQDPKSAKLQALQSTLNKIDKEFGKGTIMRLDSKAIIDIPSISTGSIALDHALGIGGVPRGRVIEVFGPESSGKTTLALHIIAETQKKTVLRHLLMLSMHLTVFMLKN